MIGIGSDHGGYELKEKIKAYLKEKGFALKDFGTFDGEAVDYPDIAEIVCKSITSAECEWGILFCGTGVGISMSANKIKGIRAAHVTDSYSAKMAKEHNNANVICMGGRITGYEIAREIVEAFINAEFAGGRHERRVNKIMNLEK